MWRDEALMLNLASFGPNEHQLVIQAGIEGCATSWPSTSTHSASGSAAPPSSSTRSRRTS
jgi:hypothetical protein